MEKRNKIIGLVFLILVLGVIIFLVIRENKENKGEKELEQKNQPNIVGDDTDRHGCIGSAGYSWCEIKQKCLRPLEEKCEANDPNINKNISSDIISKKCAIRGESASWEKIVDSVPVFKKFQQDLNLVTTSINCECYKPSCYSCTTKKVGSEFVYYFDGYFIIGEKKYLVKDGKIEMYDLESSFKTVDRFNDRVDNIMRNMYSNERMSVMKDLCFKDKIKNVLFDIYLTLGKFNDAHESGNADYPKSEYEIKLIYNPSIDSGSSGDVYFYNDQFFVKIMGGEAMSVYHYSIDGENLGSYCEDTWNQLNDDHSNPSCGIPSGAIQASDLIKNLDNKSCSESCYPVGI